MELRVPELLDGPGRAVCGDAVALAPTLGSFDLAYLDPPYNQHRYFTNYHVWETLVAWDAPEAYGVARKRIDARDPSTRSAFNSKRTMPGALASVVTSVDCGLLVLSYNDESWLHVDELEELCAASGGGGRGGRREVATLAFDSARYVGARIGIYDPSGRKVGRVGHLSNRELLVIAGEPVVVRRVMEAVGSVGPVGAAGSSGSGPPGIAAASMDRLQQAT
jgi:adenine-specific DNA-methyltransferase